MVPMSRDNARHITGGPTHAMNHTDAPWTSELLDRMQYAADPLADRTIAAILGPWQGLQASATRAELLADNARRWELLGAVSRVFDDWKDNASIRPWVARPYRSWSSPWVAERRPGLTPRGTPPPRPTPPPPTPTSASPRWW